LERTEPTRLPAFVGGFRSGSTLLINLLGLHPAIAPWFETKCLVEALRWIKVLDDPNAIEVESALAHPPGETGFSLDAVYRRMLWQARHTDDRVRGKAGNGKAANERYPIGADCIGYTLEEIVSLIEDWHRRLQSGPLTSDRVARHTGSLIRRLGDLHRQRQGGRIWVNKTPELPRLASELRRCVGECRIVHLIRDGREVALSGARLNWGSPGQIARHWAGMIRQSRQAAQGHERNYLEVRYERLASHPQDELNRVLDFLEISPDDSLVDRYEERCGLRISAEVRAFKANAAGPSRESLAEILEVADDMLEALGYR